MTGISLSPSSSLIRRQAAKPFRRGITTSIRTKVRPLLDRTLYGFYPIRCSHKFVPGVVLQDHLFHQQRGARVVYEQDLLWHSVSSSTSCAKGYGSNGHSSLWQLRCQPVRTCALLCKCFKWCDLLTGVPDSLAKSRRVAYKFRTLVYGNRTVGLVTSKRVAGWKTSRRQNV